MEKIIGLYKSSLVGNKRQRFLGKPLLSVVLISHKSTTTLIKKITNCPFLLNFILWRARAETNAEIKSSIDR